MVTRRKSSEGQREREREREREEGRECGEEVKDYTLSSLAAEGI